MLRRVRLAQLEDRLLTGPAWPDLDLVFTTGLGIPIEPGNLTRAWLRVQADAGVGHVRWHDLRHAHATLLLSQGVHPKVVSERLGHASVAITLDTYSHVLPGLQASAAAALDGLLAPEGCARSPAEAPLAIRWQEALRGSRDGDPEGLFRAQGVVGGEVSESRT